MASYSFIVLHCVSLSFLENLPSTSHHMHVGWFSTALDIVQSPAITILLRYFDMGFFFFVHLAAVLVVEYTLMDHLYFCIYLFITRPQPQSSPLHSACRMYCM